MNGASVQGCHYKTRNEDSVSFNAEIPPIDKVANDAKREIHDGYYVADDLEPSTLPWWTVGKNYCDYWAVFYFLRVLAKETDV